ncbi:hypothetical protein CBS101457_001111 [Exobasidium rhododendri]|nr:hypothetical protein CBS101457_001111 [Exobasidium rhododendri]
MDELRTTLEGKIPFQGQRLADRINQESLVLSAVVAWLAGYFTDSLYLCMLIFGASVAVTLVACVPAWSIYKKHPVIWLPNLPSSVEQEESSKGQ